MPKYSVSDFIPEWIVPPIAEENGGTIEVFGLPAVEDFCIILPLGRRCSSVGRAAHS
jgi:hypothetical protein